jgi:threonyl-tRNA synthetase
MVHRSVLGSLERLFAHLIEVHAGAFPAWYAPVQVAVAPIGPDEVAPAAEFVSACMAAGLRAELVVEGSLGARARDARRVPYLAVLGPREVAAGQVSLRPRGEGAAVLDTRAAIRQLIEGCRPAEPADRSLIS